MKRCLNCMNEYPDEYGDLCPSCGYMDGATLNGGVALQPGTILQARYIIGTVQKERDTDIFYIGWDALFDRRVQIQEYFPRYCATRSGKPELSIYDSKQEIYEKGLELFYQQSRLLIRLYREEDIITYHACFMENRTAYAIMDFSQDMTLKKRLENHLFSVANAQACLDAAMEALMKVHQLGKEYQVNLYHGQIEPESFWERPDGRLVLKDFGASRYVSGEPGIVDYGNGGTHTDVYGLAKLFCWLITGKEIEDGEKLEGELSRKQIGLKKPVVEALKRALLHKTQTLEAFQRELWGRKRVAQSRKEKKKHGSLALPRWIIPVAALAMVGIIVFTGLVATGRIDLRMRQGESQLNRGEIRVPNVVNKSVKEAERILKRNGLTMNADRKEFSEEIAENIISLQTPMQNSLIDSKEIQNPEVTVVISLGKQKAALPPVVGLDREEAVKALNEAGFMKIKEEESQEKGVFDSVLKVSEEQETQVALTTEITITICKNKTAQEGDKTVQVTVPDVVGMTEEEAKAALEESGLMVNRAEKNSDQPEGTILAQEPKAGEEVNKDSFVTVDVSIGAEKIYMKNVELESREDAEKVIAELGLTVQIKKDYSDSVAEGKVISQSIAMDAEVKPGDEVTLVISLGKKPAEEKKEGNKPAPAKPKATQAPPAALPPDTVPAPVTTEAPTPALQETSAVPESSLAPEESSKAENVQTPAPTTEAAQTVESRQPETPTQPSVQPPAPNSTPAPVQPQAPAPTQTQTPPQTSTPAPTQTPAPTTPAVPAQEPGQQEIQQKAPGSIGELPFG